MRFTHHIFICANQKAEGKPCCGEAAGLDLVKECRRLVSEKGLKAIVRAQRAGCLDACDHGPVCVVYPQGTYYHHLDYAKLARIVNEHIGNNQPVSDFELTDFTQK